MNTQRRDLAKVLADSPSLRSQADSLLPEAYREARSDAASETGLSLDTYPEMCPWTVTELLGE